MLSTLINLEEYPVDQPNSVRYRALIDRCQEQLSTNRLVNIENFLHPRGVVKLVDEIQDRLPAAFHARKESSPYGIVDTDDLAEDHPYRIRAATERYGLGRHDLLQTSLDAIYTWPPLVKFVGDVLGLSSIYLHDDPSNALVAQIYKPGCALAWHFDRAFFSTILNLQETEQGGTFECVPDLRTQDDPCFDDVRDVLLDRSDRVMRYHAKAGSFTIMLGRYTLHRVTTVCGAQSRISVVLSYEDQPGVRLDEPTRRLFFGPTAPADH